VQLGVAPAGCAGNTVGGRLLIAPALL
jgi:hypothetical protein